MQNAQQTRWSKRPHFVTMGSMLNATARRIRICAKWKRWWNANIKERMKVVRREKWRWRNSDVATSAKAELQKSIQNLKSKMWSKYLHNLRGVEVWKAAKYANPWAETTVEPFTDGEGKQANTSLQMNEMLLPKSFPQNDKNQYYKHPPAGSAHTHITEQAVELALYSRSDNIAPGLDNLFFGAIWLIGKWYKQRIMRLTNVAISKGRQPSCMGLS